MLEQDQVVDIECQSSGSPTTTPIVSNLPRSEEVDADLGIENITDSAENLLEIQPTVNFDLELMAANSTTKIANYGHSYNLKVSIDGEIDRRFRVHSCFAKSNKHIIEV